ncbi:uncharacterized protein [Clytia hemisphaerica]|uniref:Uncharacterized protein n=1 Tax=Clytia hemisphaerica TaxID=252671 RepID=A0A7M5WIA1_9CNID
MAGTLSKGHVMGALVLGAIELLCGLLVIILSVVLAKKAQLPAAFSPWWAGVVFAIPGIIGVLVGVTKNYCAMIAFMVVNIIAFIIQGVGAVLLGIAMAIYLTMLSVVNDITKCQYNPVLHACQCRDGTETLTVNGVDSCGDLSGVIAMAIALIAFLAIAGCVSLAASIVGCCGTCCNNNSSGGAVVYNK